MKIRMKNVWRWSPTEKLLRMFRIGWRVGNGPGDGRNYDAEITFALCRPWWFGFRREYDGWLLWFCGLRVHRDTSWGGGVEYLCR